MHFIFKTLPVVITVFMMLQSADADTPKKDRFNNPKPLDGDVVVSMPCDQIMVFRKVYTSHDKNKIKDKSFRAGSTENVDVVSESLNNRFIQGAFHDKNGYFYLMSKYELTQLQYNALTSDKCPKPSPKLALPAVNISYFDAMNAANKYSLYLQTAKDAPKFNGQTVFARMPMDSEFEFAVRGGLDVPASSFDADLPKIDGELNDYAAFAGPQSANGKLAIIGSRKPNNLGIFDLLGNANEMMFDTFRATRTGRLHGQAGGFIVRGGSFLTSESEISSAFRKERAFYVNGKENVSRDASTRFVLSANVISDVAENKSLAKEISKLGYDSEENASKVGGNSKTVEQLDKIIANNQKTMKSLNASKASLEKQNEQMKEDLNLLSNNLTSLKQDLIKANSMRDDMRDETIVSRLINGGLICSIIHDYGQKLSLNQRQYEMFKDKDDDFSKKRIVMLKQNIAKQQGDMDILLNYYGSSIVTSINTFGLPLIKNQLDVALKQSAQYGALNVFILNYIKELEQYSKEKKHDIKKNEEQWYQHCMIAKKQSTK